MGVDNYNDNVNWWQPERLKLLGLVGDCIGRYLLDQSTICPRLDQLHYGRESTDAKKDEVG